MMRFVPRSIRGRMLALSAIATIAALAAAAFVLVHVLDRIVTQGVDRRLDAQLALLATSVDDTGALDRSRLAAIDSALFAGPGWQWQIETPGETISSAAFPRLDGPAERHRAPPGRGPRPAEGYGPGGEAVHARRTVMATAAGPVRLSASAPRAVIERPVGEALLPLLALLAALASLLGGALFLQLRFGLRPLDRLRASVAAVRDGAAQSVPQVQAAELQPLADELNDLLRDNAAALGAARATAANLAHALKTPVAALYLELGGQPEAVRLVDRIDATIRHHLSRARGRLLSDRWRTPVAPAVEALAATITRLNAARGIFIETVVPADLIVALDPSDLDEILGNLLDNAVRHAGTMVAVRAEDGGRTVTVEVADDGPGIAEPERARAMAPGIRLDERGEGSGFGLSIARELAILYGGDIQLATGAPGGLVVVVTLPKGAV
ncbi:HAMP domain-containing sensor histidine kinase [Sphingopyxis sp. KK2]|uniref:sensor histidine kinase n=1 Tax=Sphingopyxis sp. KK2 TaxID=1855727 RepID=UPI00097E5E38|nr:HAMP domain-containing sensor histidine kinase [Sphingopyxis sp. KK2]